MILDNHMGLGSGGFLCIVHGYRKYCARVVFSFSLCAPEVIRLSFAVPRRGCSSLAAVVQVVLFVTFYADVTEGRYGMLEHFVPTSHCLCMYEQAGRPASR